MPSHWNRNRFFSQVRSLAEVSCASMNEHEGIATTPFPAAALSVDEKNRSHVSVGRIE
jgi:hypothetical protein